MPPIRERMRLRDRDEFLRRRKALGSLRAVAELADCSHQFLSELETGQKVACRRAVALGIAHAFNEPVDELFVRVDQADEAADREVS